jgi:transcriptional regulator
MLEIYKRIRARREELGISQEELAKRMGYRSRSSINKIENGEDKEKVKKALELIFWDAKEKNKRKK